MSQLHDCTAALAAELHLPADCMQCELQVYSKAVTVPGRALAGIISNLKACIDPEAFDVLHAYHQLVVSHLRAMSSGSSSDPEVKAMQEQLSDRLDSLKALAGIDPVS